MLVRVSGAARDAATNGAVQTVSENDGSSSTDRPDSEVDPWFRDMARELLGRDAGLQIAVIAGIGPRGERSCYRYAAGTRAASAGLLRALLRSAQGKQFFHAVMDGCEAEWWREHQDLQRRADAFARIVEITKRE